MPFSSLLFLSGFLPLFLLVYWSAPARAKNAVALGWSVLFYAWGAPTFLPVVLGLGVIDYFLGHRVFRRKGVLALGVVMHLSTLCYFKYSNFFVEETNRLLSVLPSALQLHWAPVLLPIGISFITFEEISYLTDLYRGDAQPARSLPQYLLFLMLFPHSIAGPIFRWKDLEKQLQARLHDLDTVLEGFTRFSLGLGKKVLIANSMALAVDPIFALAPGQLGPPLAWVGAVAYSLQIYFDFSGYSDMAIGRGKMAGFRFMENFDHPFVSASITEFWRRWHISLSTWLRDYLYIPLGGSRGTPARVSANLLVVFFLSGLWHGASWTFVVWGVYHGFFVVLERQPVVVGLRKHLPRALQIAATFLIVTVGWVFFRASTIGVAGRFLLAMAGLAHGRSTLVTAEFLSHRTLFTAAVGLGLSFLPPWPSRPRRAVVLSYLVAPACLVLAMAYLANSKFNPLIYFKF